jgi:SAM-dependent methyltransferase
MKTVVSVQDLLEREIKPNALLTEYLRLTAESIAARWSGGRGCTDAPCQGCGSEASQPAFEKLGLPYRVCQQCGTLFVSPRPDEAALVSYYRESPAAHFWHERILAATGEARQEKLAEPRALWVLDTLAEHAPDASIVLDVSSHGSALVEALLQGSPALRVIAAQFAADLDYATVPPRVEVRPGALADLAGTGSGSADAILAFDALDRTADLATFVAQAHTALRPGGLLFVTAPSVSGFDLQVLWERSEAITPPDKLNLLSAEGWFARFPRPAWDVLEFSTPGMFDVENVRRAVLAGPGDDWPRFIRTLVAKDEAARVEFQAYLQQFRLASFARLVIQRAA